MRVRALALEILPEKFAVCRLPPGAALPPLPAGGRFFSMTRTADEFTLILPERMAPAGARIRHGFRALKVTGSLDFEEVGVLASLTHPLAEVGITLFAVSTCDTNYILVRQAELNQAVAALRSAGHTLRLVAGT